MTTSSNVWTWTSYDPAPDSHSFLQIDGKDVDWGLFSNGEIDGDTGHTYEVELEGSNVPVVFQIIDWYDDDYTNNYCHLVVYIYEIW